MTIPTLSNALRTAIAQSLAALPDKSPDEDLAMMQALKHVIQRIHQGETGLYEPLHKGDSLALTLGEMD